ncbi:MAG: DNA cytosine methyltransferase [Candidatus Pacearchaeota archaeon]|nr:DNA cytosine methyltransferase [Candidatus Pacearchaeota archaeon]
MLDPKGPSLVLFCMEFIDLFCGGGFGARGAVRGGGTPVLGVDAWEIATKTYKDNFPEADVICSKIEDLDPKKVARNYQADVLLTSPECTSHSIARGNKPACDRSRETAIGIVPWLQALNPRWLIVENVNRMKKWDRHNELVQSIEDEGYTVNDLYLNAAEFGTPQARKRMFLICDREGEIITKENLLSSHGKSVCNANSIIDWSGDYKSTPLRKPGRAQATLDRAQRAIDELGENVPFLIVYYGSDYAGGWQTLDAPLRTVTTIDRFGLVTWQNGEPYLRMLQPPELLQAMGAGKTVHKLDRGSRREKIKLCGNGVCSPVLEVIFRKIIELNGRQKLKKAS